MNPFIVVDVLDMITLQVKANPDTITTMVECLLNLLVVRRAIKLRLCQLLGCFMSYPTSCKTHSFLQESENQMDICKDFEAACREQALMKATKTKAKRNKKLKISEAALIEASYLYQQYQHYA